MIIRYPTAFYKPLLPKKASDAGDVTFNITTKEPPRPRNYSIKVPEGIAPTISRETQSRDTLGILVYTVTDSSQSILDRTTNQYVLGEILEFLPDSSTRAIASVPSSLLEIRHDLTRIDYDSIGLSPDDVSIINSESDSVQNDLRQQLNEKQQKFEDLKVQLANEQKALNEANKTLSAVKIIEEQRPSTSITSIIDKLITAIDDLNRSINEIIIEQNALSIEINDILDKARSLGVVVI